MRHQCRHLESSRERERESERDGDRCGALTSLALTVDLLFLFFLEDLLELLASFYHVGPMGGEYTLKERRGHHPFTDCDIWHLPKAYVAF